ncbi:MAG TPA: rhodanese-like domain-containing protein [Planctomycetota bacterium]|nr:rhodanese-like domain-containing protein [Planctomycetota bacterium]
MGFLGRLFGGGRPAGAPLDLPCPAAEPAEAAESIERGAWAVLDVRFEGEFARRRIPGARLLPLPELPARVGELPRDGALLVVCGSGERSLEACRLLRASGFEGLRWLRGGLAAYPGPFEEVGP